MTIATMIPAADLNLDIGLLLPGTGFEKSMDAIP
jgi:hypothetical protein